MRISAEFQGNERGKEKKKEKKKEKERKKEPSWEGSKLEWSFFFFFLSFISVIIELKLYRYQLCK